MCGSLVGSEWRFGFYFSVQYGAVFGAVLRGLRTVFEAYFDVNYGCERWLKLRQRGLCFGDGHE